MGHQPLSRGADADLQIDDVRRRVERLERRLSPEGGSAIYAIEVFEIDSVVIPGDGAFEWEIPEDLDGAAILKVEGYVNTPSGSGPVEIQLANEREAGGTVDVLTNKIVIEAGDLNSKDAATQPLVDTANEDVVWGDHIRVDVDSAGSGTLGLGIIVYLTPAATKSLAVQGAKGDPGGVTSWTGQWQTATAYTTGQAVSHNGSSYVAIADHTSDASTEPGVGVDWEDAWMLLAAGQQVSEVVVQIASNGYPLDVGLKAFLPVYFDCEIVEATLLADQAGDAVVDIWKDDYGSHPPTVADSITSASPLTLASAVKTTDTSLAGWTTAISSGDVLAIFIDSIAIIQVLTVALKVTRV